MKPACKTDALCRNGATGGLLFLPAPSLLNAFKQPSEQVAFPHQQARDDQHWEIDMAEIHQIRLHLLDWAVDMTNQWQGKHNMHPSKNCSFVG